jgi:hypothetical protein
VEESIANKISISNKILGIGENQPSTSSTTRAENEMGTIAGKKSGTSNFCQF